MNAFEKIYELTYLPLVTPYNLLDNLKLDNYEEINYKKIETGIIAEIICQVEKVLMKFYYSFNKENKLESIYYYENGEINFLFNRYDLLTNLRSSYINNRKSII